MKIRLVLALLLLAALMRILPHWPNFTPLAAMGLFGAALLERKWMAFAATFLALFLSDLVLNNVVYAQYYDGFVWFTSWWQYLSFGLVVLLGSSMLSHNRNWGRIGLTAAGSSLVFFLVSNFSVWVESGMYPKNTAGLLACYTAGLPFLAPTVLGDLFYTAVLFGGFSLVYNRLTRMPSAA
ncbi:MAG: DUF6580 family putative transport protein [Saprospiraceae bacterium]|nr:DUF6580 family putative transport protein [Saprospiraceae bacterium]